MRFGVLLHPRKPDGLPVARQLVRSLEARGLEVSLNRTVGQSVGAPKSACLPDAEVARACDVLAVVGGDGSLLRAAALAAPLGKPIWGINAGRLGFLTETTPGAVDTALDRLERGEYHLETRMMVGARAGNTECAALNEIVLARPQERTMLRVDVYVGEQKLDRFFGDGLLVASPTGSTAYWLSCGGPVVEPSLECLLLSAICPHSLRTRPVILPPGEVITAHLHGQECVLLCDGDAVGHASDQVSFFRAPHSALFVRFEARNYYALLQMKMAEW